MSWSSLYRPIIVHAGREAPHDSRIRPHPNGADDKSKSQSDPDDSDSESSAGSVSEIQPKNPSTTPAMGKPAHTDRRVLKKFAAVPAVNIYQCDQPSDTVSGETSSSNQSEEGPVSPDDKPATGNTSDSNAGIVSLSSGDHSLFDRDVMRDRESEELFRARCDLTSTRIKTGTPFSELVMRTFLGARLPEFRTRPRDLHDHPNDNFSRKKYMQLMRACVNPGLKKYQYPLSECIDVQTSALGLCVFGNEEYETIFNKYCPSTPGLDLPLVIRYNACDNDLKHDFSQFDMYKNKKVIFFVDVDYHLTTAELEYILSLHPQAVVLMLTIMPSSPAKQPTESNDRGWWFNSAGEFCQSTGTALVHSHPLRDWYSNEQYSFDVAYRRGSRIIWLRHTYKVVHRALDQPNQLVLLVPVGICHVVCNVQHGKTMVIASETARKRAWADFTKPATRAMWQRVNHVGVKIGVMATMMRKARLICNLPKRALGRVLDEVSYARKCCLPPVRDYSFGEKPLDHLINEASATGSYFNPIIHLDNGVESQPVVLYLIHHRGAQKVRGAKGSEVLINRQGTRYAIALPGPQGSDCVISSQTFGTIMSSGTQCSSKYQIIQALRRNRESGRMPGKGSIIDKDGNVTDEPAVERLATVLLRVIKVINKPLDYEQLAYIFRRETYVTSPAPTAHVLDDGPADLLGRVRSTVAVPMLPPKVCGSGTKNNAENAFIDRLAEPYLKAKEHIEDSIQDYKAKTGSHVDSNETLQFARACAKILSARLLKEHGHLLTRDLDAVVDTLRAELVPKYVEFLSQHTGVTELKNYLPGGKYHNEFIQTFLKTEGVKIGKSERSICNLAINMQCLLKMVFAPLNDVLKKLPCWKAGLITEVLQHRMLETLGGERWVISLDGTAFDGCQQPQMVAIVQDFFDDMFGPNMPEGWRYVYDTMLEADRVWSRTAPGKEYKETVVVPGVGTNPQGQGGTTIENTLYVMFGTMGSLCKSSMGAMQLTPDEAVDHFLKRGSAAGDDVMTTVDALLARVVPQDGSIVGLELIEAEANACITIHETLVQGGKETGIWYKNTDANIVGYFDSLPVCQYIETRCKAGDTRFTIILEYLGRIFSEYMNWVPNSTGIPERLIQNISKTTQIKGEVATESQLAERFIQNIIALAPDNQGFAWFNSFADKAYRVAGIDKEARRAKSREAAFDLRKYQALVEREFPEREHYFTDNLLESTNYASEETRHMQQAMDWYSAEWLSTIESLEAVELSMTERVVLPVMVTNVKGHDATDLHGNPVKAYDKPEPDTSILDKMRKERGRKAAPEGKTSTDNSGSPNKAGGPKRGGQRKTRTKGKSRGAGQRAHHPVTSRTTFVTPR